MIFPFILIELISYQQTKIKIHSFTRLLSLLSLNIIYAIPIYQIIVLIQKNKLKLSASHMSQQYRDLNPKSSLLWNVVDPDDPYDIRKSMIARLPQHTQNYMGDHIQIVCLMQAAEIERLNIYLSQFKLKYRELERKELDRHSYEIQIKQLSEKANEYSKMRTDNEKLRQFIKRQSLQIQQLSKRPNISSSMESEHQQLLKKYQGLLSQLQASRQRLDTQTISILKLTEQNKDLRIKYDRLDKQRLTQLTKQREKYELKIVQRISIEIKQVEHKLGNKIYQLESDCKLYKEQIESKNLQITNLLSKIKILQKEVQSVSGQKSAELEQKILELQSINLSLKNKIVQLQTFESKYKHIEIELIDIQRAFQRSEEQNRIQKNQLDRFNFLMDRQKNTTGKDLQEKTRELQRINSTLSMKASQLERIYTQYTYIEGQLQQAQKILRRSQEDNRFYKSEIEKLNSIINKQKAEESRESEMRVEQFQNKLALLSSQVERLLFVVDNKTQALHQAEEKQNMIRNEYQSRIRLLTSQYESKLSKKQSQFHQTQTLQTEIKTLRALNQELKTRNESLSKQISHYSLNMRRVYQLQEEIKKITITLNTKNEQIFNLQTKIRSNQNSSTNANAENIALRKNLLEKDRVLENLTHQCSSYEQKIRSLLKELENKQQLRKQLQKEVINGYQLKNNYENSKILLSQGQQIAQKLRKEMLDVKKVLQQYQLDIKKGTLVPSSVLDSQIHRNIEEYRRRVTIEKQQQIRKILEQKVIVQRNYSQLFQHKKLLETELTQLHQKLNKKQRQLHQNMTSIENKYLSQIQELKNGYKLVREQNDKVVNERNRLLGSLADVQRQISLRNKEQIDIENKIQTLVKENEQLRKNNAQLYQQLNRINKQSEGKSEQIRRENTKLKQEIAYIQQRLTGIQRQLQLKNEQLRNQNNQINRLRQQLSASQQSLPNIRREVQEKIEENTMIRQQLHTVRQELTVVNQRIVSIRSQNEFKLEELHRQNVRIKQELTQAQQRNLYIQRELEQKLAKFPLQLQQKENITISLERQLKTARQEIKTLQATYQNSNLTMKNYRERLTSVSQQIDRLNRILLEKNNEIENIKRQFDRMEPTYHKQIQDKNTEINSLQSLIANLQGNIRNKEQQINTLKSFESFQVTYKTQLRQKQDEINSLRNHIQKVQSTYVKQVNQKQQLIKSLRTQYESYDSTIKKYIKDIKEKDQYIVSLSHNQQTNQRRFYEKDEIINTLRAKLQNIQIGYQKQLREKDEQIRANGDKILRMAHQKDSFQKQIRIQYESKIKSIIQNQQKSLVMEKNSLLAQIQKHTMTIRSYEAKIQTISSQRQQLIQQVTQYQRSKSTTEGLMNRQRELEIEVSNLRQILKQLEDINQHTTQQRDKLFQLSHNYKEQIERYKLSQNEYARNENKYIQISNKYNQLSFINIKYQEEIKKQEMQFEQVTRQKKQYQLKLNQTIIQIERLTKILTELQGERQNNGELISRINQLELEYANSEEMAKQWEAKYVQLYQMYNSQTQKSRNIINQYQLKIKILEQKFQEVERLVNNSKQENIQLRIQLNNFNDLIEKNRTLSTEIDRLNIIVINLKQQLSDTRLRLTDQMALEKRLEEYVTLMVVLFAEIQTLRNRVSATQKQCEDVRRSSLTPHRIDRQGNVSRSLERGRY